MRIVLYAILILIALYLFFFVFPCILSVFITFKSRKSSKTMESSDLSSGYYGKSTDEMREALKFTETLPSQEVFMTASQGGLKLAATYRDRGSDKTAILFHGYNSNPTLQFAILGKRLWEMGFNLLIPDQRSHGRSEGRDCFLGLREQYDVLDWIDWAEKNNCGREFLLAGSSMGCTALEYASDKLPDTVRMMILDCGFLCPGGQMAIESDARHLPTKLSMPLMTFFTKLFFGMDIGEQTTEHLVNCKVPCFFLHGMSDTTVPIAQGMANFEACAAEKEMLTIDDAGHTLSYNLATPEERSRVHRFIANHFSGGTDE